MSSYFDVLSWTRARKNREALEKTNPQNPVLNDDDEQFLQRITSQEAPAPPLPTIEPTVIDDEGNEKEADVTQKEAAEMILPASPGEAREKRTWASYIPNVGVPSVPAIPSLSSLRGHKAEVKADGKEAAEPEDVEAKAEDAEAKAEDTTEDKEAPLDKPAEVSSQDDNSSSAEKIEETAEAAKETVQETVQDTKDEPTKDESTKDEQLTSDSTTASEPVTSQEVEDTIKDEDTSKPESEHESKPEPEPETEEEIVGTKDETTETKDDKTEEPAQRTWASYIPAMPTLNRNTKAKETAEAAAKSQTPEAKEQDEREVSVLLDRLNLSAINNRVFSFSDQSQKLYGEFTLILKDMVNGAPTAYEDLETLLKENEKHLEQMFGNMPPFVQTLVKSLPSKFASSMGPEIMAMAGDKPGNDLKKRMEAATASQASSSASAGIQTLNLKKKQKKKVPNIKDLASQKGTVTSMLTNIVNFLKVRFPAFVTGTNVVMSLAVFILLFVFWYCHKRGKEVRMLRESESTKASANVSEVSDSEVSSSEDEKDAADEKAEAKEVDAEEKAEQEQESDTEEDKTAAAKNSATEMPKQKQGQEQKPSTATVVGGPDNAAATRAKKILES